jgi:16S rRNA (adenine1518-N6/adenine1519-N6)-dimethyltransferase
MSSKSKLGQNFLHDIQAIQRIVAALGDLSDRTVVEIGPGHGAITSALAARAAHLIAVEYDRELAARLRVQLALDGQQARVTIVEQDVLQFDFPAASASAGQRLLVAGNLPYYITSPILLKLATNAASIDRAVLMVQREVADRVAAQPGSRDYGLLSVTVQLYGSVEKLFTLPPSAFSPAPEVHSTVFRWRFAPRFEELAIPEDRFPAFVRQCFAQKRKTLANNLRAAGFDSRLIATAMEAAAIHTQARAESLSIESFALLWRSLDAEMSALNNS